MDDYRGIVEFLSEWSNLGIDITPLRIAALAILIIIAIVLAKLVKPSKD